MGVSSNWLRRYLGRGGEKAFRSAMSKDKYWTAEAFDIMAERCDDLSFLDPQEAIKCSKILVDFGERVGLDRDRKGFSYAVLGSAQRSVGDYSVARTSYGRAAAMVSSPVLAGRVLQRLAVLEWLDGSPAAGLKIINQSMDLLNGHDLGTSLVIRGSIQSLLGEEQSAVQDQALALGLLRVGSRSYFCAVRNLGNGLVESGNPEAMGNALKLIRKGREMAMNLNRYKRRVPLALLNWVEGRIHSKLGSQKRGVALLFKAKKTLQSFKSFDYQRDALIVSGDLVVALDSMGDFEGSISEFEDLVVRAKALGLKNLKKHLDFDLGDPSGFRKRLMGLLETLSLDR